ncbi:MAG: endonuclease [Gemmatimonadales bacterium]|nr:endonuclease [Gemmatimonadales bacterium]
MNKVFAHLIMTLLVLSVLVPVVQADILVSELCDPRYDYLTDRYIEIYNSGPTAVDLTGWKVVAVGNGVEIFTWNLSGSIAAGDALVAGDQTTVDVFPVDFPDEAWSNSNATWNGNINDGARLKNGSGVVIDDIVVPGSNFENDTMVRNENITSPSLSFNVAEWTSTPVYTPSEATPGTHFPPVSEGPVLGAVTTIPAAPLPGQTVDVEIVVTDAVATITAVTLDWGTASGSLTQSIVMTNIGGDTFATISPIPAQTAGTTVFYQVTAGNDIPAETVSEEMSYSLPYTVTIQDIQGLGTVSPYAGVDVITSGVVTADFGSAFVIQDGTGQYCGLWVEGAVAPALGTEVQVQGLVQEIDSNTTLGGATISSTAAGSLPAAEVLTTGSAGEEGWEGVLVQVVDAACTVSEPATPRWEVTNTGDAVSVDDLGVAPGLILGTRYTITGPMSGKSVAWGIVPRSTGDIVFEDDTAAPVVSDIDPMGPTSLQVTYSEEVSAATAQDPANYSLAGGAVTAAVLVSGQPETVTLTVSLMVNGNHTLTIDGVEDLFGNAMTEVVVPFYYYGGDIPDGYYDSAEGLLGEPLRGALHDIIDGHHSISYDALWTAFYTTDDKPNGKVWDMYSDIPDGIPPYEYTFGVDQGGTAGTEGTGYNREHSWPSSWYGATSPMYTDVFMVYPTDNEVNNKRGSYPFGEVAAPTWTSLNGSKLGSCSYPGYTGIVFEPIDEYKGDFARAYFYMTARYFQEDASWPGSGMTSGAVLLPWAEALLLEWHADDPVSTKEIDRNEAVYAIQYNRNPFIDRPDFVLQVFKPELSPVPNPEILAGMVLHQNVPNPFNPSTLISYELESQSHVDLKVFNVAGHLVKTIFQGSQEVGRHDKVWRGQDQAGRTVATGVYFYQLRAGNYVETRRMLLAK